MTQIIVCTDVSICPDVDLSLHLGIAIVIYEGEISDQHLVREISHHQYTATNNSPQMEWHAIFLAIRQIAQNYENTSVLFCCDCEVAVQLWQKIAACPPAKHKFLFDCLKARCITVTFSHVRRNVVRRAHNLAKCAALSQITTTQAENTRRQLAKALEPCLPACGKLERGHTDQEGHDTNR